MEQRFNGFCNRNSVYHHGGSARLLTPADFGLMGIIMVVIGFAQTFSDMGISNAIIHRQDTTNKQLSSLYWLNIFAAVIVFCLVFASTPLIVKFYSESRLTNLIYLTSINFLITPFGQQFQILLQKELQFDCLSKIEISQAFINSTVAIGLAIMGLGVHSIIWGQLSAAFAMVLMLWLVGRRKWKPTFHFDKKDLKGYVGFGLYQMGERSINYFNSNIDYILIGSMIGPTGLGYYSLAYNLIIRPSSKINPVITKVAFPVFSRLQNNLDKLKKGYLKTLQVLAILNFPMMFGLAVVAPLAVPEIFGEIWTPSIALIQILTIVGLLRSTGNPVGSLLLAKGRADLGFRWNLGLAVTQIPGLYLGAKYGGAVGVAISFSALQGLYAILNYLILIRTLIGPCLREYVQSMWPAFWMSSVMAVSVMMISEIIFYFSDFYKLIVLVVFGALFYYLLFLITQRETLAEIKRLFLDGAN